MHSSLPGPGSPAHTCIGAEQLTISWFVTAMTAFPIIRRKTSPIPTGLTPGFLSNGISLQAVYAFTVSGSMSLVHIFLAAAAIASASWTDLLANCLEHSILFHPSASIPEGPAAPSTLLAHYLDELPIWTDRLHLQLFVLDQIVDCFCMLKMQLGAYLSEYPKLSLQMSLPFPSHLFSSL